MEKRLSKIIVMLYIVVLIFLYNKTYAAVYRGNVDGEAVIGILFFAIIIGIPLIIIGLVKNSKKTKENLKGIGIRLLKFIGFSLILSIIAAMIS